MTAPLPPAPIEMAQDPRYAAAAQKATAQKAAVQHVATLTGALPEGSLIGSAAEKLCNDGYRVYAAHQTTNEGLPSRALIVRRSDLGADRWAAAPVSWRAEVKWHLAAQALDPTTDHVDEVSEVDKVNARREALVMTDVRAGLLGDLVDDLTSTRPVLSPHGPSLMATLPSASVYGMQAVQAALVEAWWEERFGQDPEMGSHASIQRARTMLALVLPAHLMTRLTFTDRGRPVISPLYPPDPSLQALAANTRI